MFNSYIKLKVSKELWEKAVRMSKGLNNREISQEVINIYLKSKEIIRENKNLKGMQIDDLKTLETLKKSLVEAHNKHDKMGKVRIELEKEFMSMKRDYRKTKRDYEALLRNPIIEEKIVYKEDKTTIEALRKKRDKLQKKLTETRNQREQFFQEKERAEEKLNDLSNWKRKNFAVLLTGKLRISQYQLEEMQLEIIESRSYYEWKEARDKFDNRLGLRSQPYLVRMIKY